MSTVRRNIHNNDANGKMLEDMSTIMDVRKNIHNNDANGKMLEDMIDFFLILEEMIKSAAMRNEIKTVKIYIGWCRRLHYFCSGFMMEQLLAKGHMELAKLCLDEKCDWGSARMQYDTATTLLQPIKKNE
jgi:hypothetical protein